MKRVWFLVLGITAVLFLAACSTGEAAKPVEKYKLIYFDKEKYFGESGFSLCQKSGFRQCIMTGMRGYSVRLDSVDGSCSGEQIEGTDFDLGSLFLTDCNEKISIKEDGCIDFVGSLGDVKTESKDVFALCAKS